MSLKTTRILLILLKTFCVVMNTDTMDPFYWHGLVLTPVWMNNYINCKMCDDITNPFPSFVNGRAISSHILLGIWLFMHDRTKVKAC